MVLTIIGIDPGTTASIAIFDTNKNLLSVYSKKEFSLSEIISYALKFGIPVAVGTDKKNVPSFVEQFAIKTGAKIISPMDDTKQDEKRKLSFEYNSNNSHESDAIACALFAYNNIFSLLTKVDRYFKLHNLDINLIEKVKYLVITKDGFSINSAVYYLSSKNKIDPEISVFETINSNLETSKSDVIKLLDTISQLKKENNLLKNHNFKLKDELFDVRKMFMKINKLTSSPDEKLKNKDVQIQNLFSQIKNLNNQITNLKFKINQLRDFLSKQSNYYLLKKLNNLSLKEYNLSTINEGDILFIKDPNTYNKEVIIKLKNKVRYIIYENKITVKNNTKLDFLFIPANKLNILEDDIYAIVNKLEFNSVISKLDVISKVVAEYRQER